MALTRKFLSALGIDADKVDEIINAHTETVDALKNERDKYKADAEKLPEVTRELTSLKETVAKNGDKNPFEVKADFVLRETARRCSSTPSCWSRCRWRRDFSCSAEC